MCAHRQRVGTVVRRVVDHEHVDVQIAAEPFERRETTFEVRAGVVVDDHDRQVVAGRIRAPTRGINAHSCSIASTSAASLMAPTRPRLETVNGHKPVRVATAFKRLLRLEGVNVVDVAFGSALIVSRSW